MVSNLDKLGSVVMQKSKLIYNISILLFSVFLSMALVISAYIIANAVKEFSFGENTIEVKGVATKQIKADKATLVINISGYGFTKGKLQDAYVDLDNQTKKVLTYLSEQNINSELIVPGNETSDISYHYFKEKIVGANETEETEEKKRFFRYEAKRNLTITSTDVNKIAQLYFNMNKFFDVHGYQASVASPDYLVSNLDDIKMPLIAAATANAKMRADEFARAGNVQVGPMKFAKQGTFNILATGQSSDDYSYGGTYDKNTIEKTAEVVVTVKFSIR